MSDLNELKFMLDSGTWSIIQIQKGRRNLGEHKTLFEGLPGPLAFTFFENNRVISLNQADGTISLVSEGFDSQIWTYKLIQSDVSHPILEELEPV